MKTKLLCAIIVIQAIAIIAALISVFFQSFVGMMISSVVLLLFWGLSLLYIAPED